MPAGPVLYAFDGSDSARRALAEAAERLQRREAIVVTVWQSVEPAASAARVALPEHVIARGVENLDDTNEEQARETAAAGVAILREAGIEASARTQPASSSVWRTIIELADDIDAETIVLGSSGRSGLKAALLGSVSTGVAQNSSRPVLVVR